MTEKNGEKSLLNPDYLKKRLYTKSAVNTLVLGFETAAVARLFLVVKGIDAYSLWAVIIGALVFTLVITGRFSNTLVCHQFDGADESLDRQIQQFLNLPLQKGVEVFLLSCLYSIICFSCFVLLYGLHGPALYIPMAVWFVISVMIAVEGLMVGYDISTKAIQELRTIHGEAVLEKVNEFKKRNFIGLSLDNHFVIYSLFPIVVSFLLIWLMIIEDLELHMFNLPVRLAILSAMCALMVIVNSMNYFLYIKKIGRQIETVIHKVQNGEEYTGSNLDSATEIAYTAQLVNGIHRKTTAEQKSLDQKNVQYLTKQKELLTLYPRIEELLKQEKEAVQRALQILDEYAQHNEAVHTQVKESRQVAKKTAETVNVSEKALQLNIQKMKEIAISNRTATGGIQSLSNKIGGIWEIVDLIDSIADQTKIIAFNAELEAEKIARNKEQFKNVAYAIRSLTDQVLSLTGKIRADIKKIQEGSISLLDQGKSGTGFIETGSETAEKLTTTLKYMEDSASESASLSESVKITVEDFSVQVTQLQKKLQRIYGFLESYTDSINNEIDIARKVHAVMNAEE